MLLFGESQHRGGGGLRVSDLQVGPTLSGIRG